MNRDEKSYGQMVEDSIWEGEMICDECETVAHCMKNGCVPAQQEPVFSFQMQLQPGWGSQYPTPCVIGDPDLRSLFGKVGDVVTFYASPPARKPLTEDELEQIFKTHAGYGGDDFISFARAIEAKLKENT